MSELHDVLPDGTDRAASALAFAYEEAKSALVALGYDTEIRWQEEVTPERVTESVFLEQYAWVVLSSGFRETVVRRHFDYVSLCFCDWESAREIVQHSRQCVASASLAFGHQRKLWSIVAACRILDDFGFDSFYQSTLTTPEKTLRQLPYIGPVTVRHLMKNLGFDCAKPDRHLRSLSSELGVEVGHLCGTISDTTGDRLGVVDLVLWRYCALAAARLVPPFAAHVSSEN